MSVTPNRPTRPRLMAAALLGAALVAGAVSARAVAGESVRPAVAAAPQGHAPGTAEIVPMPSDRPDVPTPGAEPRTTDVVAGGLNAGGAITLNVNKSQVITTKLPYKTVNVANPEIADVNRVDDYEILLTAKKPGNTQLIVWDLAGLTQTVDVTVTNDITTLQSQLRALFPGTGILATNVNGTIALRGRVKSLEIATQAAEVAVPYSDKPVLNVLEVAGGQQVMLQVRFAEVSRTASSQLGFATNFRDGTGQFGAINGATGTPIGAVANGQEFALNPAINLFGGGQVGGTAFEVFVQALRRNSLLRVLAEPNVIAISGEQASFLAGGEFPVPVPQDGSGGETITVDYKQFGVKLNFLPIVLGDGRIRLTVEPEVSDLDYSRSVTFNGFVIPGLTKRTLKTTIELSEGQSFAVAGLLNNRIVASKDVTPLLGDLPVIGALFRSVRYERSETELVVIVTPHLVGPLNPDQVGNLPGEKWTDPTELQLFLDQKIGSVGGGGTGKDKGTRAGGGERATSDRGGNPKALEGEPVRFRGQYGFVPATN